MTDESPYTAPSDHSQPQRLTSRWWFAGGFLIAFTGMLIFVRQLFFTGNALVECRLWKFYLLEIGSIFRSSGHVGPRSGMGSQAMMMFVAHVFVSVVAGLLAAGLGRVVRRFRV